MSVIAKIKGLLNKDPERIKNYFVVSGLRLLEVGINLVRDIALSTYYGLTTFLDSYFVTLHLSDISKAYFKQMSYGILLPFYNEKASQDESTATPEQNDLMVVFLNYMMLGTLIASVIAMFNTHWLANILAPGLSGKPDSFLTELLFIALPLSVLFSTSSALRVVVVQQKKFAFFHLPMIISIVAFILFFLAFKETLGYYAVIWALPLAGLIQYILFFAVLKVKWKFLWRVPETDAILRMLIPYSLTYIFYELMIPVDNYFLSLLPDGELSGFRFANKIVTVISTLTVFSMQITLIPALMLSGSQRNWPEMKKLLGKGVIECVLVSLPIIVLAWFVAPYVVPVIFEHGAFSKQNSELVTFCFKILVLELPYYALWMVLLRCYNSLFLLKPLMWIGVLTLLSRFILDWVGLHYWGITGMAWMYVVQHYLVIAMLVGVLFYLIAQNKVDHLSNQEMAVHQKRGANNTDI